MLLIQILRAWIASPRESDFSIACKISFNQNIYWDRRESTAKELLINLGSSAELIPPRLHRRPLQSGLICSYLQFAGVGNGQGHLPGSYLGPLNYRRKAISICSKVVSSILNIIIQIMIGKRQKLPKVTDLFKAMPNKRVKPSEENKTEECQAKSIRIVPHQEGQWATFVYIKPPSEFCSKLIKTQQTILRPLLSENFPELSYDFSEADSLHISLSRTLYLKHYQLESFKANLQKQISKIVQMAEIKIKKLVILVNQEKTKIFIGLDATTDSTYLLELSNACDRAISDELKGLPEPELAKILFFKEPTFHFTLVSVNLVDPEEKEQITQLCDRLKECLASVNIKERSFQLSDEKVRLKMGDQIYQL